MTAITGQTPITTAEVTIRAAADVLPRLGWLSHEQLDPARFEPVQQNPHPSELYNKPLNGGLWCAPLVVTAEGEVLGTSFTTVAAEVFGEDRPLTEVIAAPDSRVVVVDSRADARAVTDRWPDRGATFEHTVRPLRRHNPPPSLIDWVAMSGEADVFYLTRRGNHRLRLVPEFDQPRFYGWDAATVLFLNPTFTAGPRHTVPSSAQILREIDEMTERLVAEMAAANPQYSEQEIRIALAAFQRGIGGDDDVD